METDNRIDVLKTLSVFNCILDHGLKDGHGHYSYSGVYAEHSHDGYNISLYDSSVRLDVMFHNTYQVKYEQKNQLNTFLNKLDHIYQKHH
ncbi:MAG: DUF3081 family protein [Neptuniibacter sp.]|jgi:hypothetical protein